MNPAILDEAVAASLINPAILDEIGGSRSGDVLIPQRLAIDRGLLESPPSGTVLCKPQTFNIASSTSSTTSHTSSSSTDNIDTESIFANASTIAVDQFPLHHMIEHLRFVIYSATSTKREFEPILVQWLQQQDVDVSAVQEADHPPGTCAVYEMS